MAIISEKILGKKINVVLDSSNLKEATYHTDSKTLLVEFKNGVEYEYSDVPWEIFTCLIRKLTEATIYRPFINVYVPRFI